MEKNNQIIYMDIKGKYVHLSKNKIPKLKNKSQNKTPSLQPKGLWIAKDKKWINFMDLNTSKEINGNIYHVKIIFPIVKKEKDKNSILKIGTQKSLDRFIDKYAIDNKIDWKKVSDNNSGVIFEPYFYNENMDPIKYKWYRTLDVPSGCIWNKDAMEIELIHEYKKPKERKVRFSLADRNKNFEKLVLS